MIAGGASALCISRMEICLVGRVAVFHRMGPAFMHDHEHASDGQSAEGDSAHICGGCGLSGPAGTAEIP